MITDYNENKSILSWVMNFMAVRTDVTEKDINSAIISEFGHVSNITEEAQKVIFKLKNLSLLNDDSSAERICFKNQHMGNVYLENLLIEKGISMSQINSSLKSIPSEERRAMAEAEKKALSLTGLTSTEMHDKLMRFLNKRGFSSHVSFDVANIIARNHDLQNML